MNGAKYKDVLDENLLQSAQDLRLYKCTVSIVWDLECSV
jgi:hypothetical protein